MHRLRIVHTARLAILVSLLLLLPSPHGRSLGERLLFGTSRSSGIDPAQPIDLADIQQIDSSFSKQIDRVAAADVEGRFPLFNHNDQPIGFAVRTLPQAEDIAGYRGPTEAILLLDSNQTIAAIGILNSHDTREHVTEVKNSAKFFKHFLGLTWGGKLADGTTPEIDGVSGATLTSLAMARGVLKRLGNETPSLVFDQALNIDDAQRLFPSAARITQDPISLVFDADNQMLGTLVRTGGLIDDEIGYQGPTELLLGFDPAGRSLKPRIRNSFDNEPYVGYLPQEYSFWPIFTGKSVAQLASTDLKAEHVEGVSGATMTSMTVAHTLIRATNKIQSAGGLANWTRPPAKPTVISQFMKVFSKVRWSAADIVTLGMILTLPLLLRTHWMRRRMIRISWLVAMVIVLGLWTGNLISLALIAGWMTSGASWYLAIGLLGILAVATLLPPIRRANPYCNHLCPHGALQQLIRPGSKSTRKWRLSSKSQKRLANLPAVTLAVAYLVLLSRPASDVSVIEPFHAYLWSIASWSSIGFAIATIIFSAFVPMGYCRLGCPTGRLLEHIRLKSSSSKWTRFDQAASGLLVFAILARTLT
ncbi:FMN-binding protein [Neorhodopirellula lusitana]|uniref:FMN-binding protein n=1 Tax=Neorhodopirellula lusitana TaxID=445327 RepID=UPI0024B78102|nr:FMN-binding protein [Neorhodopirellula lusitana]